MEMLKSSVLLLVTAAAAVALFAPAGSAADDTQGGCQLSGAAKVTPGLTTEDQAIDFSFTGDLTNCQGTGAVTGGKLKANGKGTGSCGGNDTKGKARAVWSNGKRSIIKFTTVGTGPQVEVAGKVTRGLFKGDPVNAHLAFQTDHPQDCASSGVSDPTFDGLATIGF
jgi:hypothetical protein